MRHRLNKTRLAVLLSVFSALLIASALLLIGIKSAWAQESYSKRDYSSAYSSTEWANIMSDFDSVLDRLENELSLNPSELASLKSDLLRIYSQMQTHYSNMQADAGSSASYGCAPHRAFTRDVWPRGEQFSGWRPHASTDIDFAEPGVIGVDVDNGGDYTAHLDIMDAYFGQANARLESERDGDMVLTVNDERGQREFLIQDGGTGPIYKCGIGEARPFANGGYARLPGSPREPAGVAVWSPWTATADSTMWYDPYRMLVVKNELDESPQLNWFIAQTISGDYDNAELRSLGEFLASLPPRHYLGTIGTVSYSSGGVTRTVKIADPRSSPANFISAMSLIYDLSHSGDRYYITFSD